MRTSKNIKVYFILTAGMKNCEESKESASREHSLCSTLPPSLTELTRLPQPLHVQLSDWMRSGDSLVTSSLPHSHVQPSTHTHTPIQGCQVWRGWGWLTEPTRLPLHVQLSQWMRSGDSLDTSSLPHSHVHPSTHTHTRRYRGAKYEENGGGWR